MEHNTGLTTPATPSSNELAQQRTDLATMRTQMAADRSLMAWVRTALSMISFGFTIYKFLAALREDDVVAMGAEPRIFGLFLVGLGTLSMLVGLIEYRQTLVDLDRSAYPAIRRPAFVVALVLVAGGAFLFFGIVAKLL
jgi:putative membrane protein